MNNSHANRENKRASICTNIWINDSITTEALIPLKGF